MQKDVIYIDVEDDITAIIGKVKAANHKVVALVPPKRIGAIQSAVNLKLVHRAANQADKRLVIISNNAALMALAGSAGIPVSKNLQSKPELAEIPALEIDEGDDVIDGSDLPVGDHAAVAGGSVDDEVAPIVGDAAIAAANGERPSLMAKSRTAATTGGLASKINVPNFDTFRKRLFIGIAAAVLLIGFLVWALFFAAHARIIITARTSDVSLNSKVSFADSLSTDFKAGTIKSLTKTLKKDVSIPFTATGKKDVGDKATGSVKFSQQSMSSSTVPAGTQLSSTGGLVYITTSTVTVPASSFGPGCFPTACAGSATGTVEAAESGSKYNAATGSLSGAPSGTSASFANPTSGGTDKVVTVPTQEDVDKVSGDVNKSSASDAAKKELTGQFGSDYVILTTSFKADAGGVKPSPAVGTEASDSKGTLAGPITYTLTALPKAEVSKYLDAYFAQQLDGQRDQKVYSNGLKEVSFTNISATETGYSGSISTNGKVGPKIDDKALKTYAKGKRYGEIQSYVKQIDGVSDVDVKFSPFWVTSAPNDEKRINVEFKVNGS
jgi:hypothetical protein